MRRTIRIVIASWPMIRMLLAVWLGSVAVGGSPVEAAGQKQDQEDQLSETQAPDSEVPARQPDVMFVPTPDSVVSEMLRVTKVTKDDLVYDLGSGDGRIVIAAARKIGARGIGVDIDPQRVKEARENARRAGVTDRVEFRQQDLFETDIREATVVTLYLLPDLNVKLRPTLLRDLRPGTRVVSHAYDMAEWEPDSTLEVEGRSVYYWVIPARVAGAWTWDMQTPSGRVRFQLRLDQNFQKLSGTMRAGGERFSLSSFRLRGDRLSFGATGSVSGRIVTMRFNGKVRQDAIAGTVRVEGGRKETWRAVRKAAY